MKLKKILAASAALGALSVASLASPAHAAPPPSHNGTLAAAGCYYFSIADVGVTVKGYKCKDSSNTVTQVWGEVQDTKADNKCAYFQVGWYNLDWDLYYYDTTPRACPSGTKKTFDWTNRWGAENYGERAYVI
ncbi:hypothetical protein [Longispora albida]|uniref:hypothetical protein n=1 Tax=Longispora albida TaxID=203523 RepID=UPI000366CB46|nr:hypothetical protein [Longispora albida]